MHFEIDSTQKLADHLAEHGHLGRTVVQGLDLQPFAEDILRSPATDAVLLGCHMSDEVEAHVTAGGGLCFPRLPDLPYLPYRPQLYNADELMTGYEIGRPETWKLSLDQRIYAHFAQHHQPSQPMPVLEALTQRLHDHAIDDALSDLLHDSESRRPVLAIMGGHAMKRTDPGYRTVARLARRLIRKMPRILLATGGGPGAMEACHVGAWMAQEDESSLDQALATLAPAPTYRHPAWLDTAFEVRSRFTKPTVSLGVPTWFYGHEPPNLFATHIAKYFSNSLREDGLLAIADRGVVYAPGSAGTIQEIFMDAAQNHYGTFVKVSPMVFLDEHYWTQTKPVYPLLKSLAAGKQYADLLAISDDIDDIVDFFENHPPVEYRSNS